ncbi:hypothetical protein ABPG72_021587 [Tetrahymena utriculariae]
MKKYNIQISQQLSLYFQKINLKLYKLNNQNKMQNILVCLWNTCIQNILLQKIRYILKKQATFLILQTCQCSAKFKTLINYLAMFNVLKINKQYFSSKHSDYKIVQKQNKCKKENKVFCKTCNFFKKVIKVYQFFILTQNCNSNYYKQAKNHYLINITSQKLDFKQTNSDFKNPFKKELQYQGWNKCFPIYKFY